MSDGMDYLRCIKCGGLEVYLQNDGVTLRCYACKYEWVRRSKLEAKIADLTRTNSALEVLVDAKVTKIAELNEIMNAKQLFIEIISKGSKELEGYCINLDAEFKQRMDDFTQFREKYHKQNLKMQSCANELEQSDLFVYLPDEENNKVNGIINKLRGKEC